MALIKMNGVDYWGSAYGQGIIAPMIYSTEEKEVGVWQDGKPLYQKTIHVGALVQDSSWHGVSHGVANLDKCINIESICIATNGTEFYPINLYRPTTSTGVMVYATASDVYYMNNYYNEMDDAYFTIQYTKTTDTAGSGIYTPSGALAVHYSTNEQVIGTWIDGKPIYEIVMTITETLVLTTNTWVKSQFNQGNMKAILNLKFVNNTGACLPNIAGGFIDGKIAFNSPRDVTFIATENVKLAIQYTKTTD